MVWNTAPRRPPASLFREFFGLKKSVARKVILEIIILWSIIISSITFLRFDTMYYEEMGLWLNL